MEPGQRIFGGVLIIIMLLFTLDPFYDAVLQLASESTSFIIIGLAEAYDLLHIGLLFVVLGLTGKEILDSY